MKHSIRKLVILLTLILVGGVQAQDILGIERASIGDIAIQDYNGASSAPSLSSDGRYLVFSSYANNIVANDQNNVSDIFLYDYQTDTIELISVNTVGEQGDGASLNPTISPDGRYVVFESYATNFANSDNPNYDWNCDQYGNDIFVYDRDLDTIDHVSVSNTGEGGDRDSFDASISADGRYVTFTSYARNLSEQDTNNPDYCYDFSWDLDGSEDVYLHDRNTGTTQLISISSGGEHAYAGSYNPSISANGRFIAFASYANNLVENVNYGVFVYDRNWATFEIISQGIDNSHADSWSSSPQISPNGRYVIFSSYASNLVPNDTNEVSDVFLYDRYIATMTGISTENTQAPVDHNFGGGIISGDGRYILYVSYGPYDSSTPNTLYLYDDVLDSTTRVSNGIAGLANGNSSSPTISTDGSRLAFVSYASNLVADDHNGLADIFVSLTETIQLTVIRSDLPPYREALGDSYMSSISTDGRFVAFKSYAENLVTNDENGYEDIFVYDRLEDTTELVSVNNQGEQAILWSTHPKISANGRFVVFINPSDNLVPNDTANYDVFVYDRDTDTIERVNLNASGQQANDSGSWPEISADGRYVIFSSRASNLVPGDTNNKSDIFIVDRELDIIERVSIGTNGQQANNNSDGFIGVSDDGRYIAFSSYASNLASYDYNGDEDVFVYDRETDTLRLVSKNIYGYSGNWFSTYAAISGNGRYVVYYSAASDLVPNDTNNSSDVFVYDIQTDTTELVSIGWNGAIGNGSAGTPRISTDGRYVSYYSRANNLIPNDTNGQQDMFVFDRETKMVRRVSTSITGEEGIYNTYGVHYISGDGHFVTFTSPNSNFVEDDNNLSNDIFVAEVDYTPRPDALLTSFDITNDLLSGADVDVSFTLAIVETAANVPVAVDIYYSTDTVCGTDDLLLEHISITSNAGQVVYPYANSYSLPLADIYQGVLTIDPPAQNGGYQMIFAATICAIVDSGNTVSEYNETNNSNQGKSIDSDDFSVYVWDINGDNSITEVDVNLALAEIGTANILLDYDGSGIVEPHDIVQIVNRIGYLPNMLVVEE